MGEGRVDCRSCRWAEPTPLGKFSKCGCRGSAHFGIFVFFTARECPDFRWRDAAIKEAIERLIAETGVIEDDVGSEE